MHKNLSLSLFILIASAFTQNAWGLYGKVTSSLPDSVCQLVVLKPDNSAKSICTASLISSTEIGTSAHCLEAFRDKQTDLRLAIKCGYRNVTKEDLRIQLTDKGTPFYSEGVSFAESLEPDAIYIDPKYKSDDDSSIHDQARIVLKKPSSLLAVDVANSEDVQALAYVAMLNTVPTFDSCLVSGFGLNSKDTAGLPFSATYASIFQIDGLFISYRSVPSIPEAQKNDFSTAAEAANPVRAYARFLLKYKYIDASLDVGDSGGPVVCLVNDKWQLVGVTEGFKMLAGKDSISYWQRWVPFQPQNITLKTKQF
jgi:hypothetical protein